MELEAKTRLKEFRKALKKSQVEMASEFSVSQHSYYMWETKSKTFPREFDQVIKRLGGNPDWIRTGQGEMWSPMDAEQVFASGERITITMPDVRIAVNVLRGFEPLSHLNENDYGSIFYTAIEAAVQRRAEGMDATQIALHLRALIPPVVRALVGAK